MGLSSNFVCSVLFRCYLGPWTRFKKNFRILAIFGGLLPINGFRSANRQKWLKFKNSFWTLFRVLNSIETERSKRNLKIAPRTAYPYYCSIQHFSAQFSGQDCTPQMIRSVFLDLQTSLSQIHVSITHRNENLRSKMKKTASFSRFLMNN